LSTSTIQGSVTASWTPPISIQIEGSAGERKMALVPTTTAPADPIFAELEMAADSSAPVVRATVVQASTVFYDTPATLGPLSLSLRLSLSV